MRIDFCGNCDFYADRECRRFPPAGHPVLVDNQTMTYEHVFVYAEVSEDTACCGEFKPIHNPKVGPAPRPPSAIMEKA